jgi:hypothetical protein
MLTTDGSESLFYNYNYIINGVGDFDDSFLDLLDSVLWFGGVNDSVVDDSVDADHDIIFGEDKLPLKVDDLCFGTDEEHFLGARVKNLNLYSWIYIDR